MATRPDPHALLCERCGYALAGLEHDGACPECGTPIAESLPSNRVGSAWQRKPGIRSLVATNLLVLRQPRAVWSEVAVGVGSVRLLTLSNLALVALTPSVVVGLLHPRDLADSSTLVLSGAIYVSLLLASLIEQTGIRFFGRNHHWRVSKDVARTVVAHATPGWHLGSTALAAVLVSDAAVNLNRPGLWFPLGVDLAMLSALLGLLAFETLVYIGMRRMRFANPPNKV